MEPKSPLSIEKLTRDITSIDAELEKIGKELVRIETRRKGSVPVPVSRNLLMKVNSVMNEKDEILPDRRLSLNLSPRKRQISSLSLPRNGPEALRLQVMSEIYCTETAYVNDLEILFHIFYTPLMESKTVPAAKLKEIFMNLPALLEFGLKLRKSLENGADLIDCFQSKLKEIGDLYKPYCHDHAISIDSLATLKKTNPEFLAVLENCQRHADCRQMDLESFLIKPVQRITKYPLLFMELLKAHPETDPEYQPIYTLFKGFRDILSDVNEEKRKRDQHEHLVLLKDNFVYRSLEQAKEKFGFSLVREGRVYLREGKLKWRKSSSSSWSTSYFYLFNDCFIRCKSTSSKKSSQNPRLSLSSSLPSSFSTASLDSKLKKIKHVYFNVGLVSPILSDDVSKSEKEKSFKVAAEKGMSLGAETLVFLASSVEERNVWLKDFTQLLNQISPFVTEKVIPKREIPLELKTPKKPSYPRLEDIHFNDPSDENDPSVINSIAAFPKSSSESKRPKKRLSLAMLPGAKLVLPASLLTESGEPHHSHSKH